MSDKHNVKGGTQDAAGNIHVEVELVRPPDFVAPRYVLAVDKTGVTSALINDEIHGFGQRLEAIKLLQSMLQVGIDSEALVAALAAEGRVPDGQGPEPAPAPAPTPTPSPDPAPTPAPQPDAGGSGA